jgi:hypothetical protein
MTSAQLNYSWPGEGVEVAVGGSRARFKVQAPDFPDERAGTEFRAVRPWSGGEVP